MFRRYCLFWWSIFVVVLGLFVTIGCQPTNPSEPPTGTTTSIVQSTSTTMITTPSNGFVVTPSGADDSNQLASAINNYSNPSIRRLKITL